MAITTDCCCRMWAHRSLVIGRVSPQTLPTRQMPAHTPTTLQGTRQFRPMDRWLWDMKTRLHIRDRRRSSYPTAACEGQLRREWHNRDNSIEAVTMKARCDMKSS